MHNSEISYKQISINWLDDESNPNLVKSAPDLIGRVEGEKVDMESVRSATDRLVSIRVPFNGAAIGVATVNVFESTNCGDDGGLVFRCTIRSDASAFQPHVVLIADGVDLHCAGEDEATAILSALHEATTQALRTRRAPRNTSDVGEVNAQIPQPTRSGPKKH